MNLFQMLPGNLVEGKYQPMPKFSAFAFFFFFGVSFGKHRYQSLSHHNPSGAVWPGLGTGVALGGIFLTQSCISSQKYRDSPHPVSIRDLFLRVKVSRHGLELGNLGKSLVLSCL